MENGIKNVAVASGKQHHQHQAFQPSTITISSNYNISTTHQSFDLISKTNTNTMKFFTAVSAAVLSFSSMASAITVSYDTGYDDASRSLNVLSCSDGANGLITKHGWQTQGAIPRFPHIGGYMGIAGWNSPQVCASICLIPPTRLTV